VRGLVLVAENGYSMSDHRHNMDKADTHVYSF
jgi:hypothetical protein